MLLLDEYWFILLQMYGLSRKTTTNYSVNNTSYFILEMESKWNIRKYYVKTYRLVENFNISNFKVNNYMWLTVR